MARELVISFLYGEFNAALVDGASIVERWTPSASDRGHGFHEGAFRFFLESVVEYFAYSGKEVVLVVGDVEMEHHHITLPPVKGKQRQQLLETEFNRQAEGRPLAWSYLYIGPADSQTSVGANGEQGLGGSDHYLLNCWPKSKLSSYLADFARVGLVPRLILPDVALFYIWSQQETQQLGSFAFINASENGTTVLLADTAQVKIFVRRLSPAIGHSRDRLPSEIRRSFQYASQDIGLRPSLLITNDQQLAIDLQRKLDRSISIEIEQSWIDQPILAGYYSAISRRDTQSFVPDDIRYARFNRLVNRVVKSGIGLAAVAAVVTAVSIEFMVRSDGPSFSALSSRYELRLREQQSLQQEIEELRDQQVFADAVLSEKQNLVYWLIRDVGAQLPEQLRLNSLEYDVVNDSTARLSFKAVLVGDNVEQLDAEMRNFGLTLASEPWMIEWPRDWVRLWRANYLGGRRGEQIKLELSGELPR